MNINVRKTDEVEMQVRSRRYERILKDKGVSPVELSGDSLVAILSSKNNKDALMHAYFMLLQMKEMQKDGENAIAFHLLGMVEIILVSNKILPPSKIFC